MINKTNVKQSSQADKQRQQERGQQNQQYASKIIKGQHLHPSTTEQKRSQQIANKKK